MTRLPPSLQAWEETLAIFPEPLALSLGPWLSRLSLGVGPLRAQAPEGRAAPDGYGGLSRRGPYERLLSSEWMLATELPEEFTRRAAMREHAFLEPSYRDEGGGRRSVALFDTGPSQLGTPRIAHLALLLVLARRAKHGGAAFAWGFLQQPETPLLSEVTPSSLLSLLRARTAVELGGAHIDEWSAALAPGKPDDVWLVGGPLLTRFTRALKASAAVVRDVLEPTVRQVSVSLRRSTAPGTALTLELPPPNLCTRLLRDPFSNVSAPLRHPGLGGPIKRLLYSVNGRRLITCHEEGTLFSHPIPSSPRASLGKARRFFPLQGHQVVAVGHGPRLLVLTWEETQGLWLHGLETYGLRLGEVEGFQLPAPQAPPSRMYLVWQESHPHVVFLDGQGGLFSLDARVGPPQVRTLVRGVRDFSAPPFQYLWRGHPNAKSALGQSPLETAPELEQDVLVEPFRNGKSSSRSISQGQARPFVLNSNVLAMELGDQRWGLHVRGHETVEEVSVPPNSKVLDVASGGRWQGTRLLVRGPDLRTLSLIGSERHLTVCRARNPVAHAITNPVFTEVAYATERSEVEVFSLGHEAVVLRIAPSPPSPGNGGPR